MTTNESAVVAAALALMRAGQWDLGSDLLATAPDDDPHILLARAELELERDFWLRTRGSGPALDAADAAAAASGDASLRWEVELLRLRSDYGATFLGDGGFRHPDEHSAELKAAFAARAEAVHRSAPSPDRAGWAAFWRGLVTENICGDDAGADPHYAEALASGEAHRDDILTSYALRHLGAHLEGEQARDYHLRSRRLRQTAGFVPGVLAEQLMLAELELASGNEERGRLLAGEVQEWASALGVDSLAGFAEQVAKPA